VAGDPAVPARFIPGVSGVRHGGAVGGARHLDAD
jgi:hypothetical protein